MSRTECKLYLGPMFSEKTTELIRNVKRAVVAGLRSVIIKYADDNRYGDDEALYTHDGTSLKTMNGIRVVKTLLLMDVHIEQYESVIAIDEGQFYPDLREFVQICMSKGKKVYISALDGDYLQRPFGKVGEVIPLCTFITKLSGICMMCKNANSSYTLRTVADVETKLIGGTEKYISVCYECYRNEIS